MNQTQAIIKRIIDILGSLFGLILLSPVLFIITILIKTTSTGPVFFKQDRLGYKGRTFKIIKFRTMVVGAEKIGTGIFMKSTEDNRITKVGKFLRETSLDELPQLINVLNGEMSLIGPRPPLTYHPYKYEEYSDIKKERFTVRPGVTGLAQIELRNSVGWDERIKKDIEYIRNYSIILDFKVLLLTVKKMFRKENIYLKKDS